MDRPGVTRIAVIGAGLAGLTIARDLSDCAEVSVFEKSSGVGGRMATRYAGDFEFDHGAQFFTARSAAFRDFLAPLIASGTVAPWLARFAELHGPEINASRTWTPDYPHYVGVPRMNAVGRALAAGLDIRLSARVLAAEFDRDRWSLEVETDGGRESLDGFDWLIVTAPLTQSVALLGHVGGLAAAVGSRAMLGCYALMLGFAEMPRPGFDAALVREADISWISVNSSKPGRKAPATMLIHATNRWADANMDSDQDRVQAHMLSEVSRVAGIDANAAVHKSLHRWRFANLPQQSGPPCYLSSEHRLGVAGDWWVRGRVEAAFQSARALTERFPRA